MHIFVVHPSDLLTDHLSHGDGLLACRFIQELASRGHTLDVACEAVDVSVRLPASITLHVLPIRGAGVIRRVSHLLEIRRLFYRLHSAAPFDLVHQLNPVATLLSTSVFDCKLPLVLGPFVPYWPKRRSYLKTLVVRLASRLQQSQADALILASPPAVSRVAVRHPVIRVVPYGIDLKAFPRRVPVKCPRLVLFLATVTERKGIFVLLDAFEKLVDRFDDVQLMIGGDGEALPSAMARATTSPRLQNRISFLGRIPRSSISELMGRATVFCAPSFGEPYGMSIVEAMASARPVVTTNNGGLSGVVGRVGGRTVPAGDSSALADAIAEILDNETVAIAMGERNRQVAEEQFAWSTIVDNIENVYAEALSFRNAKLTGRLQR